MSEIPTPEKFFGYVYETKNLLNNKYYIGLRKGFVNLKYTGSGDEIQKAVKHYGKKFFQVRILRFCESQTELNEFEEKIISQYREKYGWDNVYNIAEGGYNWGFGMTGKKHSPETIRKIKEKLAGQTPHNKGVPATLEKKTNMSLAARKLWDDPEYRRKQNRARRLMWGPKREKKERMPPSKEAIARRAEGIRRWHLSLSAEARAKRGRSIREGKLKSSAANRELYGKSYPNSR